MAIYRKLVGTTLYLRGDAQEGYEQYTSGYISGSIENNRILTSVIVENQVVCPTSCYNMFFQCQQLTSLDLSNFDTSNVTNMMNMFWRCSSLQTLNISSFNTQNVTTYSSMFQNLTSLTTLDVSNFNTTNATSMVGMFGGDSGLTTLNLTHFSTQNVRSMESMFSDCTSLQTLKIDNFTDESLNTGTQSMDRMFQNCSSLVTIECANSLTSSSAQPDVFAGCTSLQGETAKGGIAYNSSKITSAYAKISGGYFTYPKRTLTTSATGDGTISQGGTYDKGTQLSIVANPNQATYQYISAYNKTINGITTSVIDNHKAEAYTYTFALNDDTTLSATFQLRQQHTLTATNSGGYTIQGAGTYRYLDQPTLVINLGGGLIGFDGWFNGNTLVSSSNPYRFSMPDNDLSLEARAGTNPFEDLNIRQFCLQNGDGQIYKLTNKNSKLYFNKPTGLGFSQSIKTSRIGNAETVESSTYSLPQVSGELLFRVSDNRECYKEYHDFVSFITNKPITLWYKIPTELNNTYHIPIQVMSISKSEIDENGLLSCSFSSHGTNFWKATESTSTSTSTTIQILNDSDFELGLDMTLAKTDATTFTNPVITFSNNDGEYGVCAINSISGQTFTSVKINTTDGNQKIVLENGNQIITNPFGYINFAYADGSKSFPFPKLKKGYNTITFTYDGALATDNKSYTIIYDKEYLSV